MEPSQNSSRPAAAAVARALVLLVALALAAACGTGAADEPDPLAAVDSYVQVPEKPLGPAAQEITLTDGQAWRFDQTPTGRVTLLFFGYTSCPDVCPTTLADVALALENVPADIRGKVDLVFVSTDPHRDTPEQIAPWLGRFDSSFRGGRAEIAEVVAAARAYGIGIMPPDVVDGDYEVSHGAQLLVLEPGGGAVGYFRPLAPWRDIAEALPQLVDTYARS